MAPYEDVMSLSVRRGFLWPAVDPRGAGRSNPRVEDPLSELQRGARAGATLQHDVPTRCWTHGKRSRVPSAGDRPGCLPQLQAGVRGVTPEAADGTRDRWTGVPE